MKTEIIELIENIISENDTLNLYSSYSSCGADYKECPLCGARDKIVYNIGKQINEISMGTLDHADDCMYLMIKKLEAMIDFNHINC